MTDLGLNLKYTVVDAFTRSVFGGNPAAVVILQEPLADAVLQLIAREFNLSETAFITPPPSQSRNSNQGRFKLRWFTPTVEVPLCGHATLASAHVLFADTLFASADVGAINFESCAGNLDARKLEDGRIELEFPAGDVRRGDDEFTSKAQSIVAEALCIDPIHVNFIGRGKGNTFQSYLLVEVAEEVNLEALKAEPNHFAGLTMHPIVVITSSSPDPKIAFISRVFAPLSGVEEDPVTGSAHCLLGPYWARKQNSAIGVEVSAKQVSARGGEVGVVWDQEKGVCKLRGFAKVIARGEIYVPHPS